MTIFARNLFGLKRRGSYLRRRGSRHQRRLPFDAQRRQPSPSQPRRMPRRPPGPAGRVGGKRARWTGTFCSRRSVQIRNRRPRSRGRTRPCASTAPVPAHLPCWHGPQTVPAQPPVPAQAIVPAQTLRSRTGTIRGPSRRAACASTAWNHAGTGHASTERILCRDIERARTLQPPFEHTRAGTGSGSCMNSFCVLLARAR